MIKACHINSLFWDAPGLIIAPTKGACLPEGTGVEYAGLIEEGYK